MKISTGNNKYLKQLNQANILDLIRTHGTISRAKLASITGLSPTATGVITAELLEKGYIQETGLGKSSGGRRPVMLGLKPYSYYTIGIDLEAEYINMLVMDIAGNIVHERVISFNNGLSHQKVPALIIEVTSEILRELNIDKSKVLGVGISIAGIIDSNKRKVLLAPNLGWKDIMLPTELLAKKQIPIYVENEARCSAIAENWLGSCQGIDNFICINIKSGIGSGIFTNGRLYEGAYGSAGEVGHIIVEKNGIECGCGNFGCLETVASTTRMVQKAEAFVKQKKISSFNENRKFNFDDLIRLARGGDEVVLGILMESAHYLGVAISYMINILNPTKVVIGKDFIKYADLVMDCIRDVIHKKALSIVASNVSIEASSFGEKSSALGAATIPLKVLFGR